MTRSCREVQMTRRHSRAIAVSQQNGRAIVLRVEWSRDEHQLTQVRLRNQLKRCWLIYDDFAPISGQQQHPVILYVV